MKCRFGKFFGNLMTGSGIVLILGIIGGSDLEKLQLNELLFGLVISLLLITLGAYTPMVAAYLKAVLKGMGGGQSPKRV